MQGRRIYVDGDIDKCFEDAGLSRPTSLRPGDYWHMNGEWFGDTPNDLLCGLAKHTVAENGDATITVSPSILVRGGAGSVSWHGYLTAGVWKEC